MLFWDWNLCSHNSIYDSCWHLCVYVSSSMFYCRLLLPQKTQRFCLVPCQPTMEMEVAPLTWPWEESPQHRGGERYAALCGHRTHAFCNVNGTLSFSASVCHNTPVCLCGATCSGILRCETLSVCTQVELGAGDTHGPLFGMKIFRNLTPRLYVLKCKGKAISTLVFLFYYNVNDLVSLSFSDSALWPPSVDSSFHPEACVLGLRQCWPVT